jgi:hypothetical protein
VQAGISQSLISPKTAFLLRQRSDYTSSISGFEQRHRCSPAGEPSLRKRCGREPQAEEKEEQGRKQAASLSTPLCGKAFGRVSSTEHLWRTERRSCSASQRLSQG